MNDVIDHERQQEFRATFWMYVRLAEIEEGGGVHDSRRQMLDGLMARQPSQAIELMEVHDFAAVLTAGVHVPRLDGLIRLRGCEPETLRAQLEDAEQALLQAPEDADLNAYCAGLLSDDQGCAYYRDVAELISWAAGQREFQPYLLGCSASAASTTGVPSLETEDTEAEDMMSDADRDDNHPREDDQHAE